MPVTRSGFAQLALLLLAAAMLTYCLQTQGPLRTDVRHNALAEQIRQDRTSPVAENPNADVTLIIFTDYRCPACRRAHPQMIRALAADGRVRVVYKDWPIFGAVSERAAAVAIASNFQGIYPDVHDRLMTGPVGNDADLKAAVEASGGDWRRLQLDLQRRKTEIDDQLGRNRLQAFGLGLGGTPGYLIGPFVVRGALTKAQFERAFADARQAS